MYPNVAPAFRHAATVSGLSAGGGLIGADSASNGIARTSPRTIGLERKRLAMRASIHLGRARVPVKTRDGRFCRSRQSASFNRREYSMALPSNLGYPKQ